MRDRIDQAAADWAWRHPLDAAEQRKLDAWLEQDGRHAGALLRAMAALSTVEHALMPEARSRSPRGLALSRRRLLVAGGGALAAAALGLVGWRQVLGQHVATEKGEIRRLPLVDGSVATIDTSSALRIALASDSRRIALDRGQAWFQVAKDRKRPFLVDAGLAQARAVGTAFSVRRGADRVEIAVTEGTVAVWASDSSGFMTILKAGQFAEFRADAAAPRIGTAPARIERTLAWRNGEIALENEPLIQAVDQFNRYNREQLVLDDPSIGRERLVGLFKLDRPAEFADMLAASLDLTVSRADEKIRIGRKTTT